MDGPLDDFLIMNYNLISKFAWFKMLMALLSWIFQRTVHYTWEYSDSAFYTNFGVAFGLYLFRSMVANIQKDMNELKKKDITELDESVKV